MDSYPKDFGENVKYRARIIETAEEDQELQALLMAACEKDLLYFINVFCFTYNPKIQNSDRPFITYDFQDEYLKDIVNCIEQCQDCSTEKSREMGFSWMMAVLQVWSFIFKKWASLYGSYKEDYVDQQGNLDSHFERIRYVMNKLPGWMKPTDLFSKYMNISSERNGCSISGDTGQNFGTGGRRKFVILDEFAYWQHDTRAFRKTSDIAPCRIIGGTPEGKYNVYGKIMTGHKDYEHLNIKKFRLHWTQHPLKTLEWYEAEKLKRTKLDIAKELDISYDDSISGQVYSDFITSAKIGKYTYEPDRKLYTAWDFGRDMTAILWIQKDFKTNTCYLIDAYQKSYVEDNDIDINFFAAFLSGTPIPGYVYTDNELELINKHLPWRASYAGHFGDPYNANSRSGVTANTFVTQLQKHGIHVQLKRQTTLEDRIRKTHLAFRRFYVNEDCTEFIYSIVQSRYPKISEQSQATGEKTKPVHDSNSHFRTALEYWFDNEPEQVNTAARDVQEYLKKRAARLAQYKTGREAMPLTV